MDKYLENTMKINYRATKNTLFCPNFQIMKAYEAIEKLMVIMVNNNILKLYFDHLIPIVF